MLVLLLLLGLCLPLTHNTRNLNTTLRLLFDATPCRFIPWVTTPDIHRAAGWVNLSANPEVFEDWKCSRSYWKPNNDSSVIHSVA
jgi:hypothetical protein